MAVNYNNAGAVLAIVALVWIVAFAWLVLNYVLTSLSVYTIAKRRGIRAPGLAWVPVVSVWTLGSICDQYDGTRGIQRKWRTVLLTLTLIGAAGVLIAYIVMLAQLVGLAFTRQNYVYAYNYSIPAELTGSLIGSIVLLAVGALAAAAAGVCEVVCRFKFFESCRPKDALKFLLLSLLVPFAQPFCFMSCRNYDLGMPQPQQPYYPPQYPQYPQQPPVNNEQQPPYNPYQ